MNKVNNYFAVFTNLIQKHIPKVHKILNEHKLPVNLFLFEWIVTLFSNIFELKLASWLWDQIFYFGQIHIIKISLSILKCLEDVIVNSSTDYEKIIFTIKSPEIDEKELFLMIKKMKLDERQILIDLF